MRREAGYVEPGFLVVVAMALASISLALTLIGGGTRVGIQCGKHTYWLGKGAWTVECPPQRVAP